MAVKNPGNFQEQCRAVKAALGEMESLWLSKWRQLVNKHNGVDYSDANTGPPAYVQLDSDGNIKGVDFTPADYLSAMTLLVQLENFFTNAAVTQGAYKDTLAKITDAKL